MMEDFEVFVEQAMAEWKAPGLAIAIISRGELVFLKGFGLRDVEANLSTDTMTEFMICSVTKSITACGLCMLVDDGKLDLDKPVREYIPEFRLKDPEASDRISTRDLLYHRSGLPRHDWTWIPGDLSREQLLISLRYLEPNCDFRTAFQYQNLGYMVAGMVAERVSGLSWEDFIQSRLLRSLDMVRVTFSTDSLRNSANAAQPYSLAEGEIRRLKMWPIRPTPAGGINAHIFDMAKYLRFHLDKGKIDGKQLISPKMYSQMVAPTMYSGESDYAEIGPIHYGFGFELSHYRGSLTIGHGGAWFGWRALMLMQPDRSLGVIVLTNSVPNPLPEILSYHVFDRFRILDEVPWRARFKSARQKLLEERKLAEQKRATSRKVGTSPSHSLSEYAGIYEHVAYGRFVIKNAVDRLEWHYRGLTGTMSHRHYDIFEIAEDPPIFFGPLALSFTYNNDGNIDSLRARMEPLVSDIVFDRIVT